MAPSIITVLSAAFSLSFGGLILAEPLLVLTFSDQNPHRSPLISIVVHTFLFLLLPFTFISATLLLLLYVATPQSTTPSFFIKQLTQATQATALSVLLLGVPLTIYVAIADAVVPDAVKASVIGILAVMILMLFKRYFNRAVQTVGRTVPAFAILCFSTGTLLLVDPIQSSCDKNFDNPLCRVPVHLMSLCSLNLGSLLLFLHMSVSQLAPAHAVLMENLVRTTLEMGFTTFVIGLFMVIALLVGNLG